MIEITTLNRPGRRTVTNRLNRLVVWGLLCTCFGLLLPETADGFERRREQFIDTPGYMILPLPYSYPGIGDGFVLVGYAGNIFGSQTDAILLGFTGDAEGYYAMVNEIFLLDRLFYLNVNQMNVSKFGITYYANRGMDTDKDDANLLVGNKYQQSQARAILTLFDRRFELWYGLDEWQARATDIYDLDKNLIAHYEEPEEMKSKATSFGFQFDLTDDRTDPRIGLRLKGALRHHPAETSADPDFSVNNRSATLYIPLFEDSTWSFHYSRSASIVRSEGNTDLMAIAAAKGFGFCPFTGDQAACEAAILSDAQNTVNANKYGTADSLGGAYRLRSYPEGRFQGAHSELRATEFRWNFSTRKSQVDLYFLKDIIHALQLAVFWEEGSVSETAEDLGKITRSAYGLGFRFVAESGNVYRLDWATGEEGPQITALFQYPWGESD